MHTDKKRRLSIKTINLSFVLIVVLFSAGIIFTNHIIQSKYQNAMRSQKIFIACNNAANALQNESDELTMCVTEYVDLPDSDLLEEYFNIIDMQLREHELQKAESYNIDCSALREALNFSNELSQREIHAFSLVAHATHSVSSAPLQVQDYKLSTEEAAKTDEEKISLAKQLIYSSVYTNYKKNIYERIDVFQKEVLSVTEDELVDETKDMSVHIRNLQIIIAIGNLLVILVALFMYLKVTKVLKKYITSISQHEPITPDGTAELCYLANVFNDYLNLQNKDRFKLTQSANIDLLTNIANRRAFETFMENTLASSDAFGALVFLDIDNFKNINDTYGHNNGDIVLKSFADKLQGCFEKTDFAARLGGDEFAIWIDRVRFEDADFVISKLGSLTENSAILDKINVTYNTTAGITFCKSGEKYNDILKRADIALYEKKRRGKCGCIFYEDI